MPVARLGRRAAAVGTLAALGALAACSGGGASDATTGASTATGDGTPSVASAPPRARASTVGLKRIGTFDSPTYVTAPPGDRRRLFVVEQGGRIRVVRDGKKLATPFIDITSSVSQDGGERGLFSMAFAPDYSSSRRFYVYFNDRRGNIRIREYRRSATSADRADRSTHREVLSQSHETYANHNGGSLVFGPDRLLYAGLGDGGGAGDPFGSGQRLSTVLGKIIRIDPRKSGSRRYTVPSSNPFRSRRGARPEIYAYGLRNPWRFSFDRKTGDVAIADVGQDEWEEIDFASKGKARGVNYGWNKFEGRHRFAAGSAPGHVKPVLEYSHDGGRNCSITGGYVVRDGALGSLYGRYVYGDFCRGRLRTVKLSPGSAQGDKALGLTVRNLSSFGEDAAGHVYAVSLDGPVYRLVNR
jgi:glucose/arabinose dehydrogenase